jgi:uncharacterized membrane protein YfcA
LGTGDRPVIYRTRHRCSSWRTTLARPVGAVTRSCLAALLLPALFVAPASARWSARTPVALLRRLFALYLVGVAIRLLQRA